MIEILVHEYFIKWTFGDYIMGKPHQSLEYISIFPDKEYDAFVVHNEDSRNDRMFIISQMLPELEKKQGYKLCIAFREFIVGDRKLS